MKPFYKNMLLLVLLISSLEFSRSQSLLGFESNSAAEQRALEAKFDAMLKRDNLLTWMKQLSARPHHVGSAYGKQNAEFIASQFKSWGYETSIEEFYVLFPTPKTRVLEMLEPIKFSPSLTEPALPEDSTSNQQNEQLPIYNAYSCDGDVTGELVYVNFGVPKDYEELEKRGIDVRGKIVIARYFGSWRGIKPKVAAEHGAIGCIIYSDPHEDGYFEGDVYPKGAYRNEFGAQRGSVADMPLYAGDPLTPFVGATKNAKRLSVKEAKTITKIPVMPISYADAQPLLRALGGPVAPESWRGALPFTYHIGPGPTKIHLKLEFNWNISPLYNVIAKIRGAERPDEWVIRGNHHDAWVNGANDPISGEVAMMEEARAVGELLKTGWKPKRTMLYCSWDGEEPGLLGSTEWTETHADELKQKASIYINSDAYGRGFLGAGGSHTLEKFMNQVARDVVDPEKNISVLERERARRLADGSRDEQKEIRDRSDIPLYALGSGSDFTPFLQHLGISSLNIGYGGEDGGGSYHSIYDSYSHYTRFGDPTFDYGIAQAQTTGRIALRCANADVLPFDFTNFYETVAKYVKEVTKLTDDMREETASLNRLIKDKTFDYTSDPTQPFVAPKPKEPVPFLNFAPLHNALAILQQKTKEFDQAMQKNDSAHRTLSLETKKSLDNVLMKAERALTLNEGLPGRPWYVHHIYAPGKYTGYGVKTLPGVREAIEQRNWKEAEQQISTVSKVIEKFAKEIEKATELIH